MAKIVIGERTIEIERYKLGRLRKAAAYVDKINAFMREHGIADTEQLRELGIAPCADLLRLLIEVIAIGTMRVDPLLTADYLEDEVFDFADVAILWITFRDILVEAGLQKAPGETTQGEAQAPALAQAEA